MAEKNDERGTRVNAQLAGLLDQAVPGWRELPPPVGQYTRAEWQHREVMAARLYELLLGRHDLGVRDALEQAEVYAACAVAGADVLLAELRRPPLSADAWAQRVEELETALETRRWADADAVTTLGLPSAPADGEDGPDLRKYEVADADGNTKGIGLDVMTAKGMSWANPGWRYRRQTPDANAPWMTAGRPPWPDGV